MQSLTTPLPNASFLTSSMTISIPPDRKCTCFRRNLPAFGNAPILCRPFILTYISCCSILVNTAAAPTLNAAIIFSSAAAVPTNATAVTAALRQRARRGKLTDRIGGNRVFCSSKLKFIVKIFRIYIIKVYDFFTWYCQ